ncbi:hypothetical protein BGAL_0034g00400 [Botrytis galanthina]|uniref:Secreted protein n=1 Tax=Botrytis galanthina TaxID=278940 RepID=A0A4S8RHL9_9HELO|nr:hypothetical protein BGAL_0034g00400 [Botrytis galanthina]
MFAARPFIVIFIHLISFLTIAGRALAATVTSTTFLLEQGRAVEEAVVWPQYIHVPSLVAVETAPRYSELNRIKKSSSAWLVAGMALKPEDSLSVELVFCYQWCRKQSRVSASRGG